MFLTILHMILKLLIGSIPLHYLIHVRGKQLTINKPIFAAKHFYCPVVLVPFGYYIVIGTINSKFVWID